MTLELLKKEICYPFIDMTMDKAKSVFPNGPGDRGSIPGRVIPKTHKMELYAALLNTQN